MSSFPYVSIALFNVFILAFLWLDLSVIHKEQKIPSYKDSLIWSLVWVGLAFLFSYGVYHFQGAEKSLEFLTGYIIEKSLSIDNVFVIAMIFSSLKVPLEYQHRVLFWGILGAIVFRLIFIMAGTYLIHQFGWILYVFGFFLIYAGYKMFFQSCDEGDIKQSNVFKILKKYIPMSSKLYGKHFFVRYKKIYFATPLFASLVLVEISDIFFALDSIPAIFAITTDPFIVYTSNIFAILGLRSLYFMLAGALNQFHYLKTGLAVVLIFVGVKMLSMSIYKIPTGVSLGVIVGVLFVSIVLSIFKGKKSAANSR